MKPDVTMCSGCAVNAAAVTRRDFVSMATLSAVALALTACGGGADGATGNDTTGPVSPGVGTRAVRLADFPALAVVGSAVKVSNSPPIALARTAAGNAGIIAYSLSCTHQGTTVNIAADFQISCPNHGARFSAAGVWQGGQRTSSLVRLPVEVDASSANATITLG